MPTRNIRKKIDVKIAGMAAILKREASEIEGKLKRGAKWKDKTGHARQGLRTGVDGKGRRYKLYAAHTVKYGVFLEEGTKPHIIKPKSKKALYWNGASHPVKQVRHPGTKGDPLIERTLKQSRAPLMKAIERWWRA